MAKKDPFAELDDVFKNEVSGASLDQLKDKLSEVAKKEEENQAAKKADEDLNRLKEQVKDASLGYSEVTKRNKLKLKFLIRNLADKGDPVSANIVRLELAAEDQKT